MPSQETTPLLSDHQALPLHNGTRQTQGSVPISVLVSRSAWPGLSSRALHFLRAGILAYLAALVPMLVRYKAAEKAAANVTPWSILFDFSMLSYILQLHWHLLSYPGQPRSSSNNFCPSLLYTAALVFNFMNATIFPKGDDNGGVLGHGWLQTFSVINMYGVTPLIAIAEVLFLNTITHQHAVARHVLSTTYLLMGYLAWAAIGNTMTGQYPLFWMDPTEIGGAGRVAACAFGFVGLGVSAFAAVYGLTVLREKLAKYATRKTQYSPVPDSEHEHERAADQMPRRRA
ncbi:uncharacterized protein THITE_2128537 [Thermothielavioides terrestris NRRL 8126]|uniref:FAR-17a/AIG1-like protein n=1 Tax=Thermothielavioides terrestris (strain ATCC 38088 / NRRL 8126) TaxID=578455 RepID=G2R0K7_THETT|nr:uncharacterized protein THITE_2128537 [Thermothielavioides terrestris NRRL 8126]AEO66475.1 hypothetical protein THITE_2128537 [Thermothielavioides terrestris NRRL 8126]